MLVVLGEGVTADGISLSRFAEFASAAESQIKVTDDLQNAGLPV